MALLNIADWVDCTSVEGPGKRFALWVQGCVQRCPGCCNPQMFDLDSRTLMESSEVVALIKKASTDHSIEGVTFLGGEPLLQARGLSEVAAEVGLLGLSVMVFTGYRIEDLGRLGLPGVSSLLSATDLLVDGPYELQQPESLRNWVGSGNQRFHYLSNRYESTIEADQAFRHGFEMRIGPDSLIKLNGWPVDVSHRKRKVG